MRNMFKVSCVFFGLLATSSSIQAAQSNFSFSPPPIAAPEFSAGKVDRKASATYVGISGTGIDMSGFGGNFINRQANSDTVALDMSAGIFGINGKLNVAAGTKGDFTTVNFPLSIGLEYQAVKDESSSVILFGGPMMSLGVSSLKFSSRTTGVGFSMSSSSSTTSNTLLYGLQGGVQGSLNSGDFTFSPFAMFQSQQGSTSATTSASSSTTITGFGTTYSYSTTTTTTSIPSFTSTSFGLDILYRPWNMTLSSMLQEAAKSGNNEGFKTTIISLSWAF